jgi:alpha-mannosidase/octanoyl-[GcvH]:protein N-octanoyltransferase
VSGFGLNEYELLKDRSAVAVTIHRGTGELGDWGYFPTPEAQCLGETTVSYGIAFHGDTEESRLKTYHDAKNAQVPFSAYQTTVHAGQLPAVNQFLTIDGPAFALTAMKRKEHGSEIVTRGYNLTNEPQPLTLAINGKTPAVCNLLEETTGESIKPALTPAEILTYIWR